MSGGGDGAVVSCFIKICGITRLEDAALAAALGVDAIGLNFWPGSPRAVSIDTAAGIVAAAGGVAVVGVFVDAGDEWIDEVRRHVPLDLVQLHGDEPPAACARFGADGYWKAVRSLEPIGAYSCRRYVLDAVRAGQPGGTGARVDRELAKAAARRAEILLAGGLAPENVGDVVRDVRPFGVDVASGVEAAPGVKDERRLAAFVRAVRSAEGSA